MSGTVEVVLHCQYGQHAPGDRVRLSQDELSRLPDGWYEYVEKPDYTPALQDAARQALEAARRVRGLHEALNPSPLADPIYGALNGLRIGVSVHTRVGTVSLTWPPEYTGRSDVLDAVQAAIPEHRGPDGLIRPQERRYYRKADELLSDLQAWGADAGPVEGFISRLATKAAEAQVILESALERKRHRAL